MCLYWPTSVFVIVGWMLGVLVSAYFCLCDSWMDVGCVSAYFCLSEGKTRTITKIHLTILEDT